MSIRFVYFDLGNVLLYFSVHRICCQLAEVAKTTEAVVRGKLFDDQRYRQYELGEISTEDYFKQACADLENKPSFDEFSEAICNVFWANDPILPIVRKLAKHNVPRGILSNTNPVHWNYIENAFPRVWEAFEDCRLASFEVHALKPYREMYEAAYREAKRLVPDLQPGEILFIDDLEPNVQGAKEYGFQTIHYVDFDQFLEEYKQTGLPVPSRYLDGAPALPADKLDDDGAVDYGPDDDESDPRFAAPDDDEDE